MTIFNHLKQFFIVFKNYLISIQIDIDSFNDSKSQLIFESLRELIQYIFIISGILIMVLAPVVLFYLSLSRYSDYKKFCNKLKETTKGSLNHTFSENFTYWICENYISNYSTFIGAISGLATWNIFSLAYIIFYFDNFRQGLFEYFYFPFKIVNSLSKSTFFEHQSNYKTNWIIMGIILILSIVLFFIGKEIGKIASTQRLKRKNFNIVNTN